MSHRVEAAYAGPDYTPLPAHPAPDLDCWGNSLSNCRSFKLVSNAGAHIYTPHPDATLLQIYVSGPCFILANGGMAITSPKWAADNGGGSSAFPLAAAGYYSYSVDPGKFLSMQVEDGSPDVYVTVLEG